MSKRTEEILRAVAEAASMLRRFHSAERTSFDIVGAVMELRIPFVFRPLAGLWGASITVDEGLKGILVTTKLDLPIQRFTLAHELGHVLLGHQSSFDESDSLGFAGRYGPASRPTEEVAADTFASELLAPKELMIAAAKRHGWNKAALECPETVYQLSLRLGTSFVATAWALVAQKAISGDKAKAVQRITVKNLKLSLAPAALITNPWAAVWKLTDKDSGTFLEAGPDDLFAVHLQDYASAGYVWELVETGPAAEVVEESRFDATSGGKYGGPSSRIHFLRIGAPGVHRLVFSHKRPWCNEAMAEINIRIDNHGKEREGFPRRVREAALAEA